LQLLQLQKHTTINTLWRRMAGEEPQHSNQSREEEGKYCWLNWVGWAQAQTQQPTDESIREEIDRVCVLRAAEERAANTQQPAEREGLMLIHNYIVMLLYT
jgi:hypothetical protein